MTRDEFKEIARQAIEQVTAVAERRSGRTLPRSYAVGWLGGPVLEDGDDPAEILTAHTYIDPDQIFPCVDVFLEDLRSDGRLLLVCYRAGYQPCRFGEHFQYRSLGHDAGIVGPFKLGCSNLVRKLGPPT